MELPQANSLFFASNGLAELTPARCRDVLIAPQTKLPALAQPAPEIARLTAQMAKGDEAAYREFYGLYFNRLVRYLLVVTGNENSARDALQLTMLRVARHIRPFQSEPAFWSWLTVLGKSAAVDEGRHLKRYLSLLTRFFEQRQIEISTTANDTEERLLELLDRNLAILPAADRELLEQKYLERQSVREMAQQMDLSEKALESRLLRVRHRLKDLILDEIKSEHELR